MDGNNRRRSTRYEVQMEVALEVPNQQIETTVLTRDLSKGGLCFMLDSELSLGEPLKFGLSLILGPEAQSETLNLQGMVCWSSQDEDGSFQIGAAFEPLEDDILENIATFLEFIREGFEYEGDQ